MAGKKKNRASKRPGAILRRSKKEDRGPSTENQRSSSPRGTKRSRQELQMDVTHFVCELPKDLADDVLKKLRIPDLINLSRSSPEAYNAVQRSRHLPTGRVRVDVSVWDNETTLRLYIRNNTGTFFTAYPDEICFARKSRDETENVATVRRWNNLRPPEWRNRGYDHIFFHNKPALKVALDYLNYMAELLGVVYRRVVINSSSGDILRLTPILNIVPECEYLSLETGNYGMNSEDIVRLMNTIRPSSVFECKLKPEGRFWRRLVTVRNVISSDVFRFTLHFAQFFSSNWFLALDCCFIDLHDTTYSTEVFQQFIENWLGSEDTKLRHCHVSTVSTFQPVDLQRFNSKPFDEEVRGELFSSWEKQIITSEGLDIQRNDGLLATVMQTDNTFDLFVWHQRRHEYQELYIPEQN